MSTILDALKKVERDRESPRDELLDVEVGEPPRRGISTRVIVACASVGFAAGIGLALWRDTAPLQQASAPEPGAPPVIEVPPAPARPKPRVATPAPAAPEQAGTNAPGVVVPAPESAPAAATNPPAAAPAAPPAVAAPAAPPPAVAPPIVVGAADSRGSALEPSPFTAPREGAPPAPVPDARGNRRRGAAAANARAAAQAAGPKVPLAPQPLSAPPGGQLAAIAPPQAVAPPAEPAPPPVVPAPPAEAEPPSPPPVVIDTGRSPPGSPRVALTFLQWSSDPDRRFAFISIDGAPAQRVREGDSTSGMTVSQITPTGVQFKREGQVFMIRPRH